MKAAENPNQPYYPWESLEEFELVDWLASSGLLQVKINKFLALAWTQHSPLSFHTAKSMYECIEKYMPKAPGWKRKTIILDDTLTEPQTFLY
ncbi:hypothetical protein BS47DRAFT_1310148 [Hydnum rufescens UP504]|uniref:Uncharacterized protein n=1 Tax=Hydnum rufescens UP504 TaxID=1448309 RepID=A0A9P6ABY2_9AGAM|nr:hypothetical protein BS47DRAFT_1310148 [Hydnum rufescens UP504]